MHIDKIKINNFKNYISATIYFDDKINFLYGKNGAGKTNLLDAIYYLSYGKSIVNNLDTDNINILVIFTIEGSYSNNYLYKCTFEIPNRKKIYENGNKYKNLKEHIGKIPVVFVNPYDINLIRNYSNNRRRFFDQIFSQIDKKYLDSLIVYNRLIKQRNTYLKNLLSINDIDSNHIKSYDDKLITLNKYIGEKRKEEVKSFNSIFNKVSTELNNNSAQFGIKYSSNFLSSMESDVFDKYLEKDFYTKKTNIGIHNDDYVFAMNDKLIKRVGSQGQQKTYIISLRITEYQILNNKLSEEPILLLDDVFHKLDDKKIDILLDYLKKNNFDQILISDSIKSRLNKIKKKIKNLKVFKIKEGKIYER